MKCPSCSEQDLIFDTGDIAQAYKGESTTIPSVHGEFCPSCGEAVLNSAESQRVSEVMVDTWLRHQVGPAYDALKADPARAVTTDHVRARLAAEHSKKR